MQFVPIQAIPSQTLSVSLGGQACDLNIYQKSTGLYADVFVGGVLIIGGVVCQDRNRLVRSTYLGFVGDLAFIDTQGTSDPVYTGLGTQFGLVYLTIADLQSYGLT